MLNEQNKVGCLFEYIKEYKKIRQNIITDLRAHKWSCMYSEIPDDNKNISIFYRDVVEDDGIDEQNDMRLLAVHNPKFEKCPEPSLELEQWLCSGWYDYHKTIDVQKTKITDEIDEQTKQPIVINFEDNVTLVEEYKSFCSKREIWANNQKKIEQTKKLFCQLREWYLEFQRDSSTKEFIIGNGILRDRENESNFHPILTRRVKLDFNADENTIYVTDLDVQSELYTAILQEIKDISIENINLLQSELQKNDYHPLDRNETPMFLRSFVHQISADSIYTGDNVPDKWQSQTRFIMSFEPCLIVRDRLDGTVKAIEKIVECINQTGDVPSPILDLVSGGKIEIVDDCEKSVEEHLAAVGGESIDILLSKPANKEQLEIAQRIEKYNAVLVQGPPGTGKTHTIANLIGHFLAQGKSVLVTSQTSKALRVLKDKVPVGLQNLCVSVLEDSNADMEKSVDGITDYISRQSSSQLKREMDDIYQQRKELIAKLANVRKKLYQVVYKERNNIVLNGIDISPSEAAKFVVENAEKLSYIPGKVKLYTPIPVSFQKLCDIYRSNELVSKADEAELLTKLPNPDDITSPERMKQYFLEYENIKQALNKLNNQSLWNSVPDYHKNKIELYYNSKPVQTISVPEEKAVLQLKEYIKSITGFEQWMKYAAVDGKNGGAYRQRWNKLIEQIKQTYQLSQKVLENGFGVDITLPPIEQSEHLIGILLKIKPILQSRGKLSIFDRFFHKEYEEVLNSVKIEGNPITTAQECDLVLQQLELAKKRNLCSRYWAELLSVNGLPQFFDLDSIEPERMALKWIDEIKRYLDWYSTEYDSLKQKLANIGLTSTYILDTNKFDSDLVVTEKILKFISCELPVLCNQIECIVNNAKLVQMLDKDKSTLQLDNRTQSVLCNGLVDAIEQMDINLYQNIYMQLKSTYLKYELLEKREQILKEIVPFAPQWADAIRNREGIHGQTVIPNDIEDAWKWKQLSGIIDEIVAVPFQDIQAQSIELSKKYRDITEKYAEKSAWYHLLKRTEANLDIKQALQGWKLTVKKIGKGTGKNASKLKATARELMAKCQTAVPAWIMPVNRALESLNPKENKFDIVIMDEASQSDISALAVLYMGKKMIVVGDDKQVSPMSVGADIDKINNIADMYIKDKIPNYHLYTTKTSIYDIVSTTFRPLMLKEHFRCVPDIIGFSNMLSYDGNIKPLREAGSSNLLPAVVNYRTSNGVRLDNKTNPNEAQTIVALMKACIEQPEYKGKTFGVISMLGGNNAQVKCIQNIIEQSIPHNIISEQAILCGDSANFQGDERDVIFISLVDSSTENGILKLRQDEDTKKRYNVAASRAKDQLWVVHSLDSLNDLKSGDLRKRLIEYANNPNAFKNEDEQIKHNSDSPFEIAVATKLRNLGYHFEQQWNVGAYRIDIVVICGQKMIALECDGEQYHSSDAQIRNDLERQTILERLGWHFIRIRGSEYYKNPEKTMQRVVEELKGYGIEPEDYKTLNSHTTHFELLERVKIAAQKYLSEETEIKDIQDDIIAAALDEKQLKLENIN